MPPPGPGQALLRFGTRGSRGCWSRRLSRGSLVIKANKVLRDIDILLGIQYWGMLRRRIKDGRVVVFLGVPLDYTPHLGFEAAQDFPLRGVKVFLILASC